MKNAKKVHRDSATDQIHAVNHAQRHYHDNHSTFGFAPALRDEGLIPPDLASGRAAGYAFALNLSAGGQHDDVIACPAAMNRSRDCVPQDTYVDDAGIGLIHAVDMLSSGAPRPGARHRERGHTRRSDLGARRRSARVPQPCPTVYSTVGRPEIAVLRRDR